MLTPFRTWLPPLVAVGAVAMSIMYLRHRRRLQQTSSSAKPTPKFCLLLWDGKQQCFCAPTIRMDLSVLTPTLETVAAFFGSPEASRVVLTHAETANRVDVTDLQVGQKYLVSLSGDWDVSWLPIKQIGPRLEEAMLQKLSTAFYTRVWADTEHKAFRSMFVNNAGTVEHAADVQWRWLCEMWGGSKRYSESFGQGTLLPRMLSKHSAARMQYRFCLRWLQHMLAAMDEVGIAADDAVLRDSIKRYWLHFFGFFQLTAEQRRELKAVAGLT